MIHIVCICIDFDSHSVVYDCVNIRIVWISDVAGLGLSPKPARPKPFLGGPSPPEARCPKPESPTGFFGPKIGRFLANFWLNLDNIIGIFVNKKFFSSFWPEIGPKSADFRPISS